MRKQYIISPQAIILLMLSFCFTNLQGQIISDTANYEKHYVLPEFVKGSVKMKDGRTEFAVMNYNKLTEEMIFDKNGMMLALDSISSIDSVSIDSRVFVPHEKVFYEVLVRGPVSLFIQHKCNLFATGNPSGYGGTSETGATRNITSLSGTGREYKLHLPRDYYVTDASIFWIRKEGEYYKANTSKQISKAFPGKSDQIKKFVKENKLDLKNTADMVTLILKCNELAR